MQQTSTGGAGFLDGSAFYREIAIQPWGRREFSLWEGHDFSRAAESRNWRLPAAGVCFSTAFVEPDAKAELRR
jgi:hypothetical protein